MDGITFVVVSHIIATADRVVNFDAGYGRVYPGRIDALVGTHAGCPGTDAVVIGGNTFVRIGDAVAATDWEVNSRTIDIQVDQ